MLTVILDANTIIRSDWHLTSAAWRVLSYRSRHHHCRIAVPEIVIREVVATYRTNLDTTTDRANGSLRSLADLGAPVPTLTIDVDDLVTTYETALRERITEAKGTTPEPPDGIDLLGLADLAIRRQKPFDKQGSGFRDALIWEQAIASLTPPALGFGATHKVVLITNDNTAFRDNADDTAPAKQLRDRLEAQGLDPTNITLAHTMAEHVRATSGAEDEKVESAIIDLLDTEQAQIETNIAQAMAHVDVDSDTNGVRARLRQVHGPMSLNLWKIWPGTEPGDLDLVEIEAEMDADIDIDDYRADTIDQTYSLTRSVTVMLEAVYNRAEGTLDDFSGGIIHLDEDDLAPITSGLWH